METGPANKSLSTLALMAVVILAPTAVFTVTGDAPQTLVLAVVGLAVSAARRRPLPRNTRSFVYTSLGALVAATLSEQIFPVDAKRFFLMSVNLYCPPVILLAVAITYLDQRDSNISGVIGLALLAMMMAGNCLSFEEPHRRLPIPPGMDRYLHPLYGAAVAAQLSAGIALMARAPYLLRHPPGRRRLRGLRIAITVGLAVLAAAGTLCLRPLARRFEYALQTGFMQLVQTHLRHERDLRFGREVDLWRQVPPSSDSERVVVVRALAAHAPGYLRARAYTTYDGGRWTSPGYAAALPFEVPGGHLAFSVYRRPPPPAAPAVANQRTDIYPARGVHSDVLFAPGGATAFEVVSDALAQSDHGELTPTEWEPAVGYTVVTPGTGGDGAYYGPPGNTAATTACLDVPGTLREPLERLRQDLFAGVPAGDAAGAIAALEHFFGQDFRYRLGTNPDRTGGDPVLQFLQRRTGHCELFATAATLLLRSQGVPARYVTGLVCLEPLSRGQWAARLDDAHAWAEAYDARAQRWVLVEVTPAMGIPQGTARSGLLSGPLGHLAFAWQHVLALMKRGTAAEAIVAAAKALVQALGWLVLNPVGGPVTIVLLILAVRRWHRSRRLARGASGLPAPRERLGTLYAGLLPGLRRLLPELPPQPTPGLIAARVRQELPALAEPALAAALERYQLLRYGSRVPTEAEVNALHRELRLGMREARSTRGTGADPRPDEPSRPATPTPREGS